MNQLYDKSLKVRWSEQILKNIYNLLEKIQEGIKTRIVL